MAPNARQSISIKNDDRVAVSLRFDRDVADLLRERAYRERSSVNKIVNDILRQYLVATKANVAENVLAALPNHLVLLHRLREQAAVPQETIADTQAKNSAVFEQIETIFGLLATARAASAVPFIEIDEPSAAPV